MEQFGFWASNNSIWGLAALAAIKPKKLLALFEDFYQSNKGVVKINHHPLDPFSLGKGVKQSCFISTILFNIWRVY